MLGYVCISAFYLAAQGSARQYSVRQIELAHFMLLHI